MTRTSTAGSFLEDVVSCIIDRVGTENLPNCCLLTPNRRTKVYLQQALAAAHVQPVWAPRVLMIEDWTAQLAGLQPAEPLTLLLELWAAWNDMQDEDTDFDAFFGWSKRVLADFDRLDHALLDVGWVYGLAGDWQQLTPDPSELFATDEEPDRQHRLDFWRSFAQSSKESHRRLRALFDNLHTLYLTFGQRILAQGLAYQGLINRIAADRLAEVLLEDFEPYSLHLHWFWIGFSDLTASELALLRLLRSHTTVDTLWDVDSYYVDHPLHAAGRWFRESGRQEIESFRKAYPEVMGSRLQSSATRVQLIGAPGQMAQIKYLAHQLSNLDGDELNRTLVVLPDENLLFPLLMSLPAQVRDYNVTMGASLVASPFYRLVEHLFEVQTRCEIRGAEPYWPRELVQTILLHPYIRRRSFLNWMEAERDRLFQQVSRSQIVEIPFDPQFALSPALLFDRVDKPAEILQWVIDTLYELAQQLERNTRFEFPIVEREQLFAHYQRLIQLRNQLQHHHLVLDPDVLARVALLHLQTNLPYSGEPLANLQIMGLRETRNLDFDRVYVLSMNEGIVPPAPQPMSLIPDDLAPSLGLPGWRESQDHACYMIWRCLHRASHVALFYSTLEYGNQPAQPSRILDQIRYEWQLINPNLELIYPALDAPTVKITVGTPVLPADGELQTEAALWLAERGLSVTALNSWLSCRLKFGLGQLLELKELPPLMAELEARHEGTFLHEAMEALYGNLIGKQVTPTDFELLSEQTENLVRERLLLELGQPGPSLTGEAYLTEKQVVRRIREIVDADKQHAPFSIVGLEAQIEVILDVPFNKQTYAVKLKGTIDRIDLLPNGSVLLIDYKTGKHRAKLNQKLPAGMVLDWIFMPRTQVNQASLDQINQALFYLWLFRNAHPKLQVHEFAWYTFDAQGDRVFGRKLLSDLLQDVSLDDIFFDRYQALLVEQIQMILSPEVPRKPTEEVQLCTMCDFVSFCWRDEPGD